MSEVVCPIHGPYNADLGACPYCARSSGRPQPPAPLDDDLPTDPFGAAAMPFRAADFGGPTRREAEDDEQTVMPDRFRGSARFEHEEEEEDATIIDRPQTGLLGWLIVKSGGRYGHIYKIKSGALIGRDMRKADLVLDDEKISGLHAKITVKNGQFMLWDLGSSNGTYLNGEEVLGATAIHENDEIRLGNTVFVLKTLGETKA
jgi:hypothetical protein